MDVRLTRRGQRVVEILCTLAIATTAVGLLAAAFNLI